MKKCLKCNADKPEDQFSFKNKDRELRHSRCKQCVRSKIRDHYNDNRQYYLIKARERNSRKRLEILDYLQKIVLNSSCIDCGESDPVVLEFDHRSDVPKFMAVSSLIRNRYDLEIIKKEIEKCEIRCANCHRRKTARDFN
jgi:hypothetical protein